MNLPTNPISPTGEPPPPVFGPSTLGARRRRANAIFTVVCWVTASCSVLLLVILLGSIALRGLTHLDVDFFTGVPSRDAEKAGMSPALWGSVFICAICAIVALPLGVGTAIFLEEYKPRHRLVRRLHGFVQLNIANLAGVPSIVYGILGLTVFANMFGLFGSALSPRYEWGVRFYDEVMDESGEYLRLRVADRSAPETAIVSGLVMTSDEDQPVTLRVLPYEEIDALHERVAQRAADLEDEAAISAIRAELLGGVVAEDVYVARTDEKAWWYVRLPFGRGVLAGGLTLMLVVLPVVIISSQEALRAVPGSLREGALAMGSTRWQMIWGMTLPAAVPGIMTGSILAMSRAIGEAAPILILAGIVYITFTPAHLMDDFTAMPLQIYNWASLPNKSFHDVATTGIIVLLAVLLTFNATAVLVRQKFQKPLQ